MNVKKLPGTTIDIPSTEYSVRDILNSMFLAGGLVLSQVSSLTGLSSHVLQNWVKRKFVLPPVNKKYSQNQFCRIAIINFLKESMQLDTIVKLVFCINRGTSADDQKVNEYELYCLFTEIIMFTDLDIHKLDSSIEMVLQNYDKPFPGWERNARTVFHIMGTLFISSNLKKNAELLLEELNLR